MMKGALVTVELNAVAGALFDLIKCLIHGHSLDAQGNYYYCKRYGHLEVRNDLVKIKYQAT